MTYHKIAQLAGVSLSTVSKALSGSHEISGETARRIRTIAEENGVVRPKYRKDRSTLRIAIIVPEIVSVYYSCIATSLADELRRNGIEPYIQLCGFDDDQLYKIIETITDDGIIDGILLVDANTYPHKINIPVMSFGVSHTGIDCDTVSADVESGIFDALEYLKALGHRNIGFISEKNTEKKLEYFRSACAKLELPVKPESIFISSKRFEEIGCEAAEYYMKLPARPTALITAYDEVALGAIHTFTDRGIAVPDDISVIGINDIPGAAYAGIPLTTVCTFSTEIIRLGVKQLLDQIRCPEKHMIQHITVRCRLTVRNTTAKVSNKKT